MTNTVRAWAVIARAGPVVVAAPLGTPPIATPHRPRRRPSVPTRHPSSEPTMTDERIPVRIHKTLLRALVWCGPQITDESREEAWAWVQEHGEPFEEMGS